MLLNKDSKTAYGEVGNHLFAKIFRVLSILSALILIGYGVYSWKDETDKSILIMQIIGVGMFTFGGISNLLSKQRQTKRLGVFFLAVALITLFTSIINYY